MAKIKFRGNIPLSEAIKQVEAEITESVRLFSIGASHEIRPIIALGKELNELKKMAAKEKVSPIQEVKPAGKAQPNTTAKVKPRKRKTEASTSDF